jgi:hypothetical protein
MHGRLTLFRKENDVRQRSGQWRLARLRNAASLNLARWRDSALLNLARLRDFASLNLARLRDSLNEVTNGRHLRLLEECAILRWLTCSRTVLQLRFSLCSQQLRNPAPLTEIAGVIPELSGHPEILTERNDLISPIRCRFRFIF